MKNRYSRRDFLNRTSLAIVGAGAVMAHPTIIVEAKENDSGMMSGENEISGRELGQSLTGIGFNLLVTDVLASVEFAEKILLANTVRLDDFFAVLKHGDFMWMYHIDWAYRNNLLSKLMENGEDRGLGVELRLYNQDPDEAEKRAKESGYKVLIETSNKPHGLRECSILDPDGYCWVISRHLREGEE